MKIFLREEIRRIEVNNYGLITGSSSESHKDFIGTIDVKFAGEELNIPPVFNDTCRYLNDSFQVVTFDNKNYNEEALMFLISQEENSEEE